MTNLPQKEHIRQAINDYCAAKQVSKNDLATQAGVSPATLSKIEHRKWDDIDEKLWRKIWLRVNDKDAQKLFTTNDFKTVQKTCEYAQKNHAMLGLTADTGLGKTTALTAYSMRKNVFYVPYDKTMAPKHFFTALLREMGIAFEGNIHQLVNKIADELNTLSNPLLIIDEAGKITHTMILYLHVLRDKTIKNCGIVLAGMPYFQSNLTKMASKQKEGYAEFLRRINLWQSLAGLSGAEIKAICESYDITDPEALQDMKGKKRFGDLQNEISLYLIQNSEI